MPDYVTRSEAAELAGVDLRTIDRWADRGLLTRYKIGHTRENVRFKRIQLNKLLTPAPEK